MSEILVITPKDILYNNNYSILLVCPNPELKQYTHNVLKDIDEDINVYLYETNPYESDLEWLIQVGKIVDYIIIDVDHCFGDTLQLASYLIAQTKTFYLTTNTNIPYNMLSNNRVTDFDQLQFIFKRGIDEKTKN